MRICKTCGTSISVDKFYHPRPSNETEERLIVSAKEGKDICLLCVAIVTNWMCGEPLVATGSVYGWKK